MALSTDSLHTMLLQDIAAQVVSWRVTVTTPEGTQIGIASVGEGDNKLTFPAKLLVADVLGFETWARFATPDELNATPTGFVQQWWRPLQYVTKTLIHCDGSIAHPEHRIGCKGSCVTALPHSKYEAPAVETPKCAVLDNIDTPPTPTTPPPPSP